MSLFFRALSMIAPLVGRRPALFYQLAPAVAALAWHGRSSLRRRMLRNQAVACRGDRARARRAAREALTNVARYYVDLCTIRYRHLPTFERERMTLVGAEHLSILESGRPVIILSAHLGSPELAVQAVLGRGRRFIALVEPVRPHAHAALLARLREGAGGTYVEPGPSGIRACLDALRGGGIVALVADRDIQGRGRCVTLFERRLRLPDGPFAMARRTGAAVLPILSNRSRDDRLTLYVEEPFFVGCDAGPQSVHEAIERWARILEQHIARDPGQWTVTEDFWRVHSCG